ncbi:MAG: hypothetical protein A2079_01745 [Geobacteraceae bacterium GWC2_48_7]|nr:MAG: hypothetical protein A2079_01745 [Geobacteraceae bacterium GWC2_48_7]
MLGTIMNRLLYVVMAVVLLSLLIRESSALTFGSNNSASVVSATGIKVVSSRDLLSKSLPGFGDARV